MSGKNAAVVVPKSEQNGLASQRSNDLPGKPESAADVATPNGRMKISGGNMEPVDRLRSHFLASVTNEFRTPLAALNASLQYLLGDLDSLTVDEIRALLQPIHLSVIGLQTLIDNLIESTNIEAGHFSIRTGAIDIRAVINEATSVTSPLFSRRCQRVIVEHPASLPWVVGDPPRLTQVMVNLLSSASKLGAMYQTIYVELEPLDQRWLRVSVSDQKPGAPLETVEDRLSYTTYPVGSGDMPYSVELGLSVARTIVEEHGGTAGVDHSPEGGSVYWFTVPTVEQR